MGIKTLEEFVEKNCQSASVSVDLLKISKTYQAPRHGRQDGRFHLVLDAESCLDRLYGGFYSDWVCGGQWNRMISFLNNLVQACRNANLELVVYINGALESTKFTEWYAQQAAERTKVQYIFRLLSNKGIPPPKVWWVPPVFFHSMLRMALRHLGITVGCSQNDHVQEIVLYCHEHQLQGVLAFDPQFMIFNPPRYFSSNNMKLTYKGSLETTEFINDEVAKCLNLNPNRFCVLAALLGNHILTEDELYDFYKDIMTQTSQVDTTAKVNVENALMGVVNYVRSLETTDDIDALASDIFKNSRRVKSTLANKLRESIQYYTSGTHHGFLEQQLKPKAPPSGYSTTGPHNQSAGPHNVATRQAAGDMSGYGDAPHVANTIDAVTAGLHNVTLSDTSGDSTTTVSSSSAASADAKPQKTGRGAYRAPLTNTLPPATPEIMKIATERHGEGFMSPWVYHILKHGEIKLPVCLDDETSREFPSAIDLYRPIRQTIYSVLLNLNKLKIMHEVHNKDTPEASKSFDVYVKEWVVRRGNTKPTFEKVLVQPVDWKAPSIERLWLGQQHDDANRRMRAFLTIMRSESALMLNPKYVPQHLVLLCCVLRYLLQAGRILQRQELDAFLAMSVSPMITDVQTLQDLKLPSVSLRGVQLGSLFMSGIETALFANDVCGAPVPWTMCCPWLFFDGKLFQYKLLKTNNNTQLIDLCDGHVDQMMHVELMRQAIMENVKIEFAKPIIPSPFYGFTSMQPQAPPYMMDYHPAELSRSHPYHGGPKMPGGRGILGGRGMDARGGQLEVAGVVVGSWGPNFGGRGGSHSDIPPHIMSVGPGRRGMSMPRGMFQRRPIRGRPGAMYNLGRNIRMERPFFVRGGMFPSRRKKRGATQTRQTVSCGRGTTVASADGSAVVSVKQLLSTQKPSQDSSDAFADAEEIGGDSAEATVNGDAGSDELENVKVEVTINGELDEDN